MNLSPARPRLVLIVEDNPGDVDLVREILSESPRQVECTAATDAAHALDLLRGGLRPHLILLDLNLPGAGGRSLLEHLKTESSLQHIPVVVFTSSQDPREHEEASRLRANCLVNKPVDLEDLGRTIRAVDEFWLGTVKLPPG